MSHLIFSCQLQTRFWDLPQIYVLEDTTPNSIFYVGMTTMILYDRLNRHCSEAHCLSSKAYYSPKNIYIRSVDMIKGKTLFHVHSPEVQWYELASIQILGEMYELTNVRKQIHKRVLSGYDEILEETREKLQDYFALPREPWNTDVYPHGVSPFDYMR